MDFYQIARTLDPILDKFDPSPEEIATVIEIIKDTAIRSYFFKRITSLSWFEPLKLHGFFGPSFNRSPKEESDPRLYSTAHLSALDYLERVSKECSNPENYRYALQLMDIIREVTRSKDSQKSDNYRTWWYFVKILANLPTEIITEDDLDLVSEWFKSSFTSTLAGDEISKSLLPRFLASPKESDWHKAAKIVDIITDIRWVERKDAGGSVEKEPHAAIEPYWLRELFKRNATLLGERCGQKVVEILQAKLKTILRPIKDEKYSYIWRRAIEDHGQNYSKDSPRDVLVSALRDVLLAYSATQVQQANVTLRDLLAEPSDILKRIGLYVVQEQYDLHGNLFWEILNAELFYSSNLRHEVYELLRNHFGAFLPDQQNQILDIVVELSTESNIAENNLSNVAERLRWLDALKTKGNVRADRVYEEYAKLTGHTPPHPGFSAYVEAGWVGTNAPCSVEQLLNKNILAIVDYVGSYKESGDWKEPTEEGLRDVLKDAVKQIPEKFTLGLNEFLKPELLPYQYSILQAFVELSRDNKIFDKEKVLDFCLSIVEGKGFWQLSDISKGPLRPTRSWITSAIADLIKAGVRDEQLGLEEKYLAIVERILVILLNNEVPTAKGEQGDALTEAINTPKGRSLDALFYYALYKAQLYKIRNEPLSRAWITVQHIFDLELEQCRDKNLEFSALAGAYLPNLLYLSKTWVVKNINNIFSSEYETNWRSAIEGYAYVNTVHPEIYKLLHKHNHFRKALKEDFKNPRVREKVVQNIAVGYLRGVEALRGDKSLFAEILGNWQQNDIAEIISFLWMLRDAKLQANTRKRIISVWKWCFQKTKGNEESNRKILSDLNLLAVFLNKISKENKKWLLQSAPYVDEVHHSSFFLEYLDRLVDQSADEVADIYLKMLTRTTPTYNEKEVRSIVEKLYKTGVTNKANDICNVYARRGVPELLKDTYDRYNP